MDVTHFRFKQRVSDVMDIFWYVIILPGPPPPPTMPNAHKKGPRGLETSHLEPQVIFPFHFLLFPLYYYYYRTVLCTVDKLYTNVIYKF